MTIEEMKARVLQAYPNVASDTYYEVWGNSDTLLARENDEATAWKKAYELIERRATAKEKVLEQYPEAYCEKHCSGNFYVYLNNPLISFVGIANAEEGEEEADAWLNALDYIDAVYPF